MENMIHVYRKSLSRSALLKFPAVVAVFTCVSGDKIFIELNRI